MFNIAKVELKFIPDPDKYLFFGKVQEVAFLIFLINIVKPKNVFENLWSKIRFETYYILRCNNLYGYAISKFLPTSAFKWIDPKEFDLKVLEVELEYPKELRELHNNYPFAWDKIEIEREMMLDYQLKIADFYNTPIDNVKKLVPNFLIKNNMWFIMNTCDYICN